MITWATLTSGILGSFIGAVLTFAAAAFTLSRTRAGDRRREEVRVQERQEQRREAVVAEVIGALRALESEIRWAPFLPGRAAAGMLHAVMRFYLSERALHPLVANWVLEQHAVYESAVHRWRKVWWIPHVRRRRINAVSKHLGEVIGVLVSWAVGDVGDEAFDDPAKAPSAFVKPTQRDEGRS